MGTRRRARSRVLAQRRRRGHATCEMIHLKCIFGFTNRISMLCTVCKFPSCAAQFSSSTYSVRPSSPTLAASLSSMYRSILYDCQNDRTCLLCCRKTLTSYDRMEDVFVRFVHMPGPTQRESNPCVADLRRTKDLYPVLSRPSPHHPWSYDGYKAWEGQVRKTARALCSYHELGGSLETWVNTR